MSVLALSAGLLGVGGAPAKGVVVAKIIYVDSTPTSNGNNGTSWANAYTTLTAALAEAVSGDQVWVAEGTYKATDGADRTATFTLKAGVSVYGGFAGSELTLAARPSALRPTILSGDLLGNDVGFTNNGENTHTLVRAQGGLLDGFTIKGATADLDTASDGQGLVITGETVLRNLKITGNQGTNGGGMQLWADATLVNVEITGNRVKWNGGAAYIISGNQTLTNVLISGNDAPVNGSAFFIEGGANMTLTNVTMTGNLGSEAVSSRTTFTMRNSILWGNTNRAGDTTSGFWSDGQGGTFTFSDSIVQAGQGNYIYNNVLSVDPKFVNAAGKNYRLKPDSPAVNAGQNTYWTEGDVDLDGKPRKAGSRVDMGAYELPHIAITAVSPPNVQIGKPAPAVGYTTNPATSASDWNTEPTCAIYATAEETDTTVLTGALAIGSYVTRCAGGSLKAAAISGYTNGTFNVTKILFVEPDLTAVNHVYVTKMGVPVEGDLRKSNGVPTGTLYTVGQPANGTLQWTGHGPYVYTPAAGFYGSDTFTYTACLTPTNCLTGTETIVVEQVETASAVKGLPRTGATDVIRGVGAKTGDSDGLSPLVSIGLFGVLFSIAYGLAGIGIPAIRNLPEAIIWGLGLLLVAGIVKLVDLGRDWLPSPTE